MINNAQLRIGYIPQNGGNGDNTDGWWEWVAGIVTWLEQFSGWFTQAEWCEVLAGTLTDDHASGGPLDQFEMDIGQSFPELQAMRQAVVDAWRTFQRAWPWDKATTAKAYGNKAAEFATALQARMAEYAGISIGGIWPWIKTNWKTLAISGSILAVGITAAVVVAKKK